MCTAMFTVSHKDGRMTDRFTACTRLSSSVRKRVICASTWRVDCSSLPRVNFSLSSSGLWGILRFPCGLRKFCKCFEFAKCCFSASDRPLCMALQTAAHSAASDAATVPTFAQQVVAHISLPGTSAALSAGVPSAYASHMQSFPMVPPALSVMIPTNTASQSYHNSPIAAQVRCLAVLRRWTSLHAQHVSPMLHCR